MPDFWRNSGYHLLEHGADGRLLLTEDFLRAYLLRPEIRPVEESCARERALHAALMEDPRRVVPRDELAAIQDEDVRFNYEVLLRFFRALLAAESIEACYAGFFSRGAVDVPPLFLDQLAQVVLRNVLDGCTDGLEARAAELFFREQKVTIEEGVMMAADLETVEMHATGGAYGSLGRLIVEAQTPMRAVNLDVLDRDSAERYWSRDQRHDFVISLNFGRAALNALARVLERWISHFHGVSARVQPLRSIQDDRWVWHIGLDAGSSEILNALWRGDELEPGDLRRLLCLFRVEIDEVAALRPEVAGHPIYLALAMSTEGVIHMKPQNLLVNMPVARAS